MVNFVPVERFWCAQNNVVGTPRTPKLVFLSPSLLQLDREGILPSLPCGPSLYEEALEELTTLEQATGLVWTMIREQQGRNPSAAIASAQLYLERPISPTQTQG